MAGVGDTLIATPLIHELRRNFPAAELHALVLWAASRDLLEGNPHLDVVHQKNLIKAGTWAALRFLLSLHKHRFDISINAHTQGRIHYRIVARIIGARIRLSHEYENHGWLDRRLVNRTLPQDYSVHSVENNLRLLRLIEAKPVLAEHPYEIYLQPAEQQWAADYASAKGLSGARVLALHVGSGGTKNLALKRWPLDHYQQLLRRVFETSPETKVLLLGGPEEATAHAQLRDALSHPNLLTPETRNLRQAAALMRHCSAFLSVDTALMHVASAMRVPNQIVIEAPTLNTTNLPWCNAAQIIRNPVVNGRNLDYYRYDGGPIRGTDEELKRCMASVSVDSVFTAVKAALA